jgi:two-component system response regulator EvgA
MNVFVIDKSKLLTERLVAMANEATNITAVYTAGTYDESLELLKKLNPDIVMIDMGLPESKSVELLKLIKSTNRDACFIVLFNELNDLKKQYCEYLGVSFIFDKYRDVEKITPAINFLTSNKKIHKRCVPIDPLEN